MRNERHVWPGMVSELGDACMQLCVQVLELSWKAGGQDQTLQLGKFYSSYDASLRISHSPHTMASLQPQTSPPS